MNNPWQDALLNALVVNFILSAENENDPRKAINDLIEWEHRLALDPAVSSEAQALIDKGRAELELLVQLTRTILAGDDAGSLPKDFPLDGMAAERMKELLNLRRQLRLPTDEEVATYRDIFRAELDKNMHNSSASPSTEAHALALRRFVEARNGKLR